MFSRSSGPYSIASRHRRQNPTKEFFPEFSHLYAEPIQTALGGPARAPGTNGEENAISFYTSFLGSRFKIARFQVFFALKNEGGALEYHHRAAWSSISIIAATLVRNPHATIMSIITELVRGGVLREQCATGGPMAVAAAHIVFAVVGWITCLLQPTARLRLTLPFHGVGR